MGIFYRFNCTKCCYEVEAVGGRDMGETVELQTVSCRECRALHDAVVSEADLESHRVRAVRLACPEDPNHHIKRWRLGGACPRCGEPEMNGEAIGDWD